MVSRKRSVDVSELTILFQAAPTTPPATKRSRDSTLPSISPKKPQRQCVRMRPASALQSKERSADSESVQQKADMTIGAWPVQVRPSPLLGPGQLGCFATRPLQEGEVVLTMECPVRVSHAKVQLLKQEHGLSEDSFVHVVHTRPAYRFDETMLSGQVPKWYRLNHSWTPNTRMTVAGDGHVRWACLRDIDDGEELTFFYGEPDPAWCREI